MEAEKDEVVFEWYPSEVRSQHIIDLYNLLAALEMCENLENPYNVQQVKSTCFSVLEKYAEEISEEVFGE
jgi:hypothetical protein